MSGQELVSHNSPEKKDTRVGENCGGSLRLVAFAESTRLAVASGTRLLVEAGRSPATIGIASISRIVKVVGGT
jgi:hypothetical protein